MKLLLILLGALLAVLTIKRTSAVQGSNHLICYYDGTSYTREGKLFIISIHKSITACTHSQTTISTILSYMFRNSSARLVRIIEKFLICVIYIYVHIGSEIYLWVFFYWYRRLSIVTVILKCVCSHKYYKFIITQGVLIWLQTV